MGIHYFPRVEHVRRPAVPVRQHHRAPQLDRARHPTQARRARTALRDSGTLRRAVHLGAEQRAEKPRWRLWIIGAGESAVYAGSCGAGRLGALSRIRFLYRLLGSDGCARAGHLTSAGCAVPVPHLHVRTGGVAVVLRGASRDVTTDEVHRTREAISALSSATFRLCRATQVESCPRRCFCGADDGNAKA